MIPYSGPAVDPLRQATSTPSAEPAERHQLPDTGQLLTIIDRLSMPTCASSSSPTLKEVAYISGTTAACLARRFARLAGVSYQALARTRRDTLVCDLLISTGLPIKEVAGEAGYSAASDFCHSFRRHHGISPSQYRKLSKH